jgi:hypothetical protein
LTLSNFHVIWLDLGVAFHSRLKEALIYSTCGPYYFTTSPIPIPSFRRDCDHSDGFDYCAEGGIFLDFVIETYDHPLADRYVFAHGHDYAWHYDPAFCDAFGRVYGSDYWKNNRFGAIYLKYRKSVRWPPEEDLWAHPMYHEFFDGTSMPKEFPVNTSSPCCSTFFVDTEAILMRPLEDYLLIRQRMRHWARHHQEWRPSASYYCGRMFEYTWHVLLGQTVQVQYSDVCAKD